MELVQFAGEKLADAGGTGVACGREKQVLFVKRQRGQSCLCENLAKYC